MPEKHRILVFPCGSEIGLELQRSLGWCKHIDLVGASSVSSNHGKYVYKRYIEDLPFVDAPDFVEQLNRLILRENIDFVYPAHDSVSLVLAEHEPEIACSVVGSPVKTCRICRSKSLTYQTFSGLLRVPRLYASDNYVDCFPVFMKPDVGQGSRGTHKADSRQEVHFYRTLDPSLVILEYLPGFEYTVDCFTDRHGTLRYVGPRHRARVQNGISVETFPATSDAFATIADIINGVLSLRGGWFFQTKLSAEGDLVLLEIAPRIAGAMALTRNLGVNLPLLSVYDRLGLDIDILSAPHGLTMDRALTNRFNVELAYDHVYVDLDDTLIVDGLVNVTLVSFLYQCLNRCVKLHLITRNPGNVVDILAHYRLNSLFDSITQIDCTQSKADSVFETSAIFIDDSYSERHSVADKLHIPTFDLDAVESLLDSRL